MKKPVNILVRPETLKALITAKDETNKSMSNLVEDAIVYYLRDLGIPFEGGL